MSIHSRHYLTNLLGQAGPALLHHSAGRVCFTEGREVRSDHSEQRTEKQREYSGVIRTKAANIPQKKL